MNVSVSIIVPIYNIEGVLLRRCIESLLNQTLDDIEILLIDDGCPMGGGNICDEYAQQDPRIRVIHRKNGGLSAARNTGMDAARGQYLTFVDGDDFVSPNFCHTLLDAAEATNADVTLCGVDRFHPDTGTFTSYQTELRAIYSTPEDIRRISLSLLRTIAVSRRELFFPAAHYAWAHLYRVESLQGLRFNEELRRGEDRVFNFQALKYCRVFCCIPDVLYHYVVNMQSLSRAFYPKALPLALYTYRLYRNLPVIVKDPEFLKAHYIRTCCMVVEQATSYFLHPDNPEKHPLIAFRRFCREDVVAEAIKKADIREMRLCKMKLAIWCLKLRLYMAAAWIAHYFNL